MLRYGLDFVRTVISFAKFAAFVKVQAKKNLGLMQMQYKNVYIAYVSMAENPASTVKAFNEAENYDGTAPSIAYAYCIEQGLNGVPRAPPTMACPCG